MKTLKESYAEYTDLLKQAGFDDAVSSVSLLFEDLLGIDRTKRLLHPETVLSEADVTTMEQAVRQVLENIPVAYITGKAGFMGLEFSVDPNVLIPRQDTENLVEWILSEIKNGDRIMDLGTGSGCIIESLLHYAPSTYGYGVDVSEKALTVATGNAVSLGLSDRITFIQSYWFDQVPSELKADILVSNPPYITAPDMETLSEVVKHEPELALFGGDDGLDCYRILSAEGRKYLKDGGLFFFEIGYDQGMTVPQILERDGYHHIEVRKDYQGHDRMVLAHWR